MILIGMAADSPTAWPLHRYRGFGLSIDGAGNVRYSREYTLVGN